MRCLHPVSEGLIQVQFPLLPANVALEEAGDALGVWVPATHVEDTAGAAGFVLS